MGFGGCPSRGCYKCYSRDEVETEYIVSSSKTKEEALGVDVLLEEHGELMEMEEAIVATVSQASYWERSMIGMSEYYSVMQPELAQPQPWLVAPESTTLVPTLETAPQDLSTDAPTTTSSAAQPPLQMD